MVNNYSDSEMLQFLKKQYKIDAATIKQQMEMKKKEMYLGMHKYKIWQASDGYWKTKLPNETDGKFTKLVKKKNKDDLDDKIVEYYEANYPQYAFGYYYDVWVDRQRKCGRSDNTIYKYQSEYKRFFEGYPIEDTDIRIITDEYLSNHLCTVVREKQIRWKALKDVFYNVNGIFKKAMRDRIITENPCDYIDLPLFRHLCYNPPPKSTKERILSSAESKALLDKIHNPQVANTNVMTGFAIEFAMYTGMRVGEISALSWNDIDTDDGVIIINHSEKRNKLTKEVTISNTKNGKFRVFPITEEIAELLNRIEGCEKENGWYGEYIFQDQNGRITSDQISASIRRRTESREFSNTKSIHAIRRTVNSYLRCNGVSTTVASSLLGHTERVNEQNYTYDVKDIDQKRQMIEQALKI